MPKQVSLVAGGCVSVKEATSISVDEAQQSAVFSLLLQHKQQQQQQQLELLVGTGSEGVRCLQLPASSPPWEASVAKETAPKHSQPDAASSLPITCLCHLPNHPQRGSTVCLAGSASGYVYRVTTEPPGFSVIAKEPGNQVMSMAAGQSFVATAGSDARIRLYDLDSFACTRVFSSCRDLQDDCPQGHNSRVYAVQHDASSGLLVTAGWDDCVKFWDLRSSSQDPISRISGPHICNSDSMDLKDGKLLTGSYTTGRALQLWDLRQMTELCSMQHEKLYCAKFTAAGTVASASAADSQLKLWLQAPSESAIGCEQLSSVPYCLATSGRVIAVGCCNANVHFAIIK